MFAYFSWRCLSMSPVLIVNISFSFPIHSDLIGGMICPGNSCLILTENKLCNQITFLIRLMRSCCRKNLAKTMYPVDTFCDQSESPFFTLPLGLWTTYKHTFIEFPICPVLVDDRNNAENDYLPALNLLVCSSPTDYNFKSRVFEKNLYW